MLVFQYGTEECKTRIHKILNRDKADYVEQQKVVDEILKAVKEKGDSAIFEYTKRFDGWDVNERNVLVTKEEINEAYKSVEPEFIELIRKATGRIKSFHSRQRQNSWFDLTPDGEYLGQVVRPMESAGVYVPGGKAAYPSTVLMNVIPALVAGVNRIVMVTPAGKDGKVYPHTVVSACEAGVTHIYKIGGAQAIAALAFGTQTIPKVNKIVGPGNIYVALAKRGVYGHVSIDSVAGPSEILIIADESANPKYVAADMLSQAEHDELASAILLTTSSSLAKRVEIELKQQTERSKRKTIIETSLNNYGSIIVGNNINELITLSNEIAPEHLEICTDEPFALLPQIKNAGAIFMGHYTTEALGDYMAGPNHVLPTGGTAKFFSPLSVDDFIKKSSLLYFTEESMEKIGKDVIEFAKAEGLYAHANAVQVRLNDKI